MGGNQPHGLSRSTLVQLLPNFRLINYLSHLVHWINSVQYCPTHGNPTDARCHDFRNVISQYTPNGDDWDIDFIRLHQCDKMPISLKSDRRSQLLLGGSESKRTAAYVAYTLSVKPSDVVEGIRRTTYYYRIVAQ